MSRSVDEWIEKAEEDFHVALSLRRSRRHPAHNATCFHAQQCVEKYLKAALLNLGIPFAKTHDLLPLLDACSARHALWATWHDDVEWLSQYAVLFRYPGESATADDAKKAVGIMKKLCPELRHALRLAPL